MRLRVHTTVLSSLLAVLSFTSTTQAAFSCTEPESGEVAPDGSQLDVLFLLDASHSMCPYIKGLKNGLAEFLDGFGKTTVDAKFGLVVFGGEPSIRLPFVSSADELKSALEQVRCDAGGQEASFEAMRRVLPPIACNDMDKKCPGHYTDAQCSLQWRSSAQKVIVHMTDEDSDMPVKAKYRVTGQNESSSFCQSNYNADGRCHSNASRWEPSWTPNTLRLVGGETYSLFRSGSQLRLSDPYLTEIGETASQLIKNNVYLVSVVSRSVGTDAWANMLSVSIFNERNALWRGLSDTVRVVDDTTVALQQFGHPLLADQKSDFSQFSATSTLKRLQSRGLATSLQAQMLANGGFMRTFDITMFAQFDLNSTPVLNFYREVMNNAVFLQTYCSKTATAKPINVLASASIEAVLPKTTIQPQSTSFAKTTTTVTDSATSTSTSSQSTAAESPLRIDPAIMPYIIGAAVALGVGLIAIVGIVVYRRRKSSTTPALTSAPAALNRGQAQPSWTVPPSASSSNGSRRFRENDIYESQGTQWNTVSYNTASMNAPRSERSFNTNRTPRGAYDSY